MKSHPLLTVLVVVALALPTGCEVSQEQIEPEGPGRPFTLTATIEQPVSSQPDASTKTTLMPSSTQTKSVHWQSGDVIKVFSGDGLGIETTMITQSSGATAEFTTAVQFDDSQDPDPDTSHPYYAIYPCTATSNSSISPTLKDITITLGDQNYVENSFDDNATPMTASMNAGSTTMEFKQVCGILKLQLTGSIDVQVSSIRVTSNAGEYLKGEATIDHNGGTPTVTFNNPSQRYTYVDLICNPAVSLSATTATIFYIVLPPTNSTSVYGYMVDIFTNKGRMSRAMPSNDDRYKIARSGILSMDLLHFTADPPVSTSNCYRVAPNTTNFTFNAGYKGDSQSAVNAISPASVGVLWETGNTAGEVVSRASYDATTRNVTLTTANAGNAVIAAYEGPNSTGNILWSWHIWVTDYDPNNTAGQCVYYSGATMMDRNLGALSNTGSSEVNNVDDFGLLYQWGRKDPFIGAGVRNSVENFAPTTGGAWDSKPSDATTGTVGYATQHPQTFITTYGIIYDWLFYADNNLWSSTKTLYDPCPAGWRVPDDGVWENWPTNNTYDSSKSGMEFGSPYSSPATWYPAGRFLIGNGILSVSGESGNWTCSSFNSFAYCFYIYDMNIWPSGEQPRASALSVRCQKEEGDL